MEERPKEKDFETIVSEPGCEQTTVTDWEAYLEAKDKWEIEAEKEIERLNHCDGVGLGMKIASQEQEIRKLKEQIKLWENMSAEEMGEIIAGM